MIIVKYTSSNTNEYSLECIKGKRCINNTTAKELLSTLSGIIKYEDDEVTKHHCSSECEEQCIGKRRKRKGKNGKEVEEKKQKIPLDEIVSSILSFFNSKELIKKKSVLCPFHEDKNASACLYPRGGFKCFVSGCCGYIRANTLYNRLKELNKI